MTPITVALIVKNSPSTRERDLRNMGWWSYDVPEFTWTHYSLGSNFRVDRRSFIEDIIFVEDGGNWGKFVGPGAHVIYHSIDDTLTAAHFGVRLDQAKQSDLVLVDHGRLENFRPSGKHVRRWNYCVNDRLFKPGADKTFDVTFHCASNVSSGNPGGERRTEIRQSLDTICKRHAWTYRSGAQAILSYAQHMGASRVICNWPRTITNRPHRVFDAMASGAALLTGPIPEVDGDNLIRGRHYQTFESDKELESKLISLLSGDSWAIQAAYGAELIRRNHTWSIRAAQLRQIIREEFGI